MFFVIFLNRIKRRKVVGGLEIEFNRLSCHLQQINKELSCARTSKEETVVL